MQAAYLLTLIVILVLVLVVLAILRAAVCIVPQQRAWVVERLGRFHRVLPSGFNRIVPLVDRVAFYFDMREIPTEVPAQVCISLDNTTLTVDGFLYLQITDAIKAAYGSSNPFVAAMQLAQTSMRSEIGKLYLDQALSSRQMLNAAVAAAVDEAAVEDLPVGKFHGVGPVTAAKMNALGMPAGLDMRRRTRGFLAEHFGKIGDFYYAIARGEDARPVNPDRTPKSIGAETTFERDLRHWDEVSPALEPVLAKLWEAYTKAGQAGRTVTVKVKFADFQQITRRRSLAEPIASRSMLDKISFDLLRPQFPPRLPVRLLGVTVSNFDPMAHHSGAQLLLWFL